MTPKEYDKVAGLFKGSGLPHLLEQFTFNFLVEGVSLNCTHQLVRTRMGAGFLQQSMRTNDARNMRFSTPETVRRIAHRAPGAHCGHPKDFVDAFLKYAERCGLNTDQFVDSNPYAVTMDVILEATLRMQKCAYAAMVDCGIPFQDARRYLGSGHQTYLWCNYNWPALKGVIGNRTEHCVMDWEIDCVVQLMHREIYQKCPKFMWEGLGSRSDMQGREAFAGVSDWPSSEKWPGPERKDEPLFKSEQCPFFILSPSSLAVAGDPQWIPTNGVFPWLAWEELAEEHAPNHPWLAMRKKNAGVQ
jgi:thymidylate synthase ThyX